MNTPRNIAGPKIRALRLKLGWSQSKLATKCQVEGLDISREVLAKMECRIRYVADFELVAICHALGVTPDGLIWKEAAKLI